MRFTTIQWVLVLGLLSSACGDSDSGMGGSDAGRDATTPSADDSGAPKKDAAPGDEDSGMDATVAVNDGGGDSGSDSGGDDDSGSDNDAGGAASFTVPSGGGSVSFMVDGKPITFDFPASAAGKDIELVALDPLDVTFADPSLNAKMRVVIDMRPHGTVFADPVKVVYDGALLALNIVTDGTLGSPLALAPDRHSLLLSHFSKLAIPFDVALCDTATPWQDMPNSTEVCTNAPFTTFRRFTCNAYPFCFSLNLSCCIDPSVSTNAQDGCATGDDSVVARFSRVGPGAGNTYPFCSEAVPTLTSVSPSELIANSTEQVITLTGTRFDPNGSVYINSQLMVPTTWISATSATGIVPTFHLNQAGTLYNVGYINPTYNATGPCTAANTGNCAYGTKSNSQNLPVVAPP